MSAAPPASSPDQALSGAPAADLEWTETDEPRSTRFNDVYFSRDDGLAETRAVFLDGCGLPGAWTDRRDFVVAELGLGTGLNVLALLELWRRTRPAGGRLHIFSVEGFPMRADEARRALDAWPELSDLAALMLSRWPAWTPGFHRIDLPELDVVLDVAIGDAAWALSQWQGQADAWFLDGFSPSLNPEMWSDAVLDGVAARSAPGARLATFTVAGAVRRGLAERGFVVEKRPGHGRKRQRLEARFGPETADRPGPQTIAVIGAGIAGASVARALRAQGLSPILLASEEADRAAASGFPAALVTPRLDAGDAVISGLHAQALFRAASLYRTVQDAITAEGVLQLEQADRDAPRFARIADQPIWPPGAMRVFDARTASSETGEPQPTGGLEMSLALAVRPAKILEAFLVGIEIRADVVARIERSEIGWRTLDARGVVLTDTEVLVLAAGWGVAGLAPELNLRPVRGQADWVEQDEPMQTALAWGGYLAPTGHGFLFGATHDRDQTSTETREADSQRNRAALAARLPERAAAIENLPTRSRAAVRATTADRLPVCGPAPDRPGVFVLGGLGSRGFCVAPLLGEHLAATIAGRPSPLPRAFAVRLDPARVVGRAPLATDAGSEDKPRGL